MHCRQLFSKDSQTAVPCQHIPLARLVRGAEDPSQICSIQHKLKSHSFLYLMHTRLPHVPASFARSCDGALQHVSTFLRPRYCRWDPTERDSRWTGAQCSTSSQVDACSGTSQGTLASAPLTRRGVLSLSAASAVGIAGRSRVAYAAQTLGDDLPMQTQVPHCATSAGSFLSLAPNCCFRHRGLGEAAGGSHHRV